MAGIYKIQNVVSGKVYVGSTRKSFMERWNKHRGLLKQNKHPNPHLQHSWNKHGEALFTFDVLEELREPTDKLLIGRELYYATQLGAIFNIAKIDRPGCTTLGRKLSEQHKQKIAETMKNYVFTDLHKKHISDGVSKRYKNGFSAVHRKNISLAKIGKVAYEMTDDIRQKISQNRIGFCRGESHVNYKGKYRFTHPIHGEVVLAQCDLVRNYGISECKASLLCSGKRKSHKKWECKGKVE
jgi:group I intron endonuclease